MRRLIIVMSFRDLHNSRCLQAIVFQEQEIDGRRA